MSHSIKINGSRLWQSLMEMAKIGSVPNDGSCRLTLTKEDKQARDLFCTWCMEAGCDITIDRAGNIFATRPGRDNLLPVATGSHLDTQPHGGRFDGIYGVLAGLEVIRTLNDLNIETQHPITVVNWTNEEGVRYPRAMLGSSAYAGKISLEELYQLESIDGQRFDDDLERIGYAGSIDPGDFKMAAFFEAHIEQGPVLEAEGISVGIVSQIQGLRWFEIWVSGQDNHAGTVPMPQRKDSFAAVAQMSVLMEQMALEYPDIRLTIGKVDVLPNSSNTIPGETKFQIDLRHPDETILSDVEGRIRDIVRTVANERGLGAKLRKLVEQTPLDFDPTLLECLKDSVRSFNLPIREMQSGALHDSARVALNTPTAMLFIPCRDGISHNEAEYATPEDVADGANVLARAMSTQACII